MAEKRSPHYRRKGSSEARALFQRAALRARANIVEATIDAEHEMWLSNGQLGGVAQQKPGEHEGCPLALHSPLHVEACA